MLPFCNSIMMTSYLFSWGMDGIKEIWFYAHETKSSIGTAGIYLSFIFIEDRSEELVRQIGTGSSHLVITFQSLRWKRWMTHSSLPKTNDSCPRPEETHGPHESYLTVHEVLRPVEVIRTPKGTCHWSGARVTEFWVGSKGYGTQIRLQTGEILQENFYNDNLRVARSGVYVSDGKKKDNSSIFTYYGLLGAKAFKFSKRAVQGTLYL